MKFCPYCGAELMDEEVSFCMGCGRKITKEAMSSEENATGAAPASSVKKKKKPQKAKKRQKKQAEPIPEVMGEAVEDGYDGYYSDVLPPDLDRVREGLDRELIKRIAVLAAVVLLIINLCVIMMYIL